MSIFFICMRAGQTLAACGPFSSSVARDAGTICHDSPKRSFSQPHWLSAPPSATSAAHSRSVSAWSSLATAIRHGLVEREVRAAVERLERRSGQGEVHRQHRAGNGDQFVSWSSAA